MEVASSENYRLTSLFSVMNLLGALFSKLRLTLIALFALGRLGDTFHIDTLTCVVSIVPAIHPSNIESSHVSTSHIMICPSAQVIVYEIHCVAQSSAICTRVMIQIAQWESLSGLCLRLFLRGLLDQSVSFSMLVNVLSALYPLYLLSVQEER